jgi:hypothetical protein
LFNEIVIQRSGLILMVAMGEDVGEKENEQINQSPQREVGGKKTTLPSPSSWDTMHPIDMIQGLGL